LQPSDTFPAGLLIHQKCVCGRCI